MTSDDILDSIRMRTDFVIAQIADHTGKVSVDQKITYLEEYVGRVDGLLSRRQYQSRPWWKKLA